MASHYCSIQTCARCSMHEKSDSILHNNATKSDGHDYVEMATLDNQDRLRN